jgi:hypothetical protein
MTGITKKPLERRSWKVKKIVCSSVELESHHDGFPSSSPLTKLRMDTYTALHLPEHIFKHFVQVIHSTIKQTPVHLLI